jgi:NAD(P)-dependent dehydrogenase (short-subunit alcohol dehydrogenase family)
MDLFDKTCIVTGASSGLGFEVTKGLARRGADTTLLCRDRARGEAAVLEIEKELPDAVVELAVCDLASLASIGGFLDEFTRSHSKLDILYNNAAVMKPNRTITEDGFEMMFHVNYLAPFVLMTSLLDSLKRAPSPLIINATSPSYKLRMDLGDLQFTKRYRMYRCFFQTKLYLLIAALELSRRREREGVAVTMIVPGRPFRSNLVRDVRFGWVKNLFSGSVQQAGEDLLSHIDAAATMAHDGRVFEGRTERPLSPYWQDRQLASDLWSTSEQMIEARPAIPPRASFRRRQGSGRP